MVSPSLGLVVGILESIVVEKLLVMMLCTLLASIDGKGVGKIDTMFVGEAVGAAAALSVFGTGSFGKLVGDTGVSGTGERVGVCGSVGSSSSMMVGEDACCTLLIGPSGTKVVGVVGEAVVTGNGALVVAGKTAL